MVKKFSVLLAATAAFTFAVPAFAPAAPTFTNPPGVPLLVGERIQSTSTNLVVLTSPAKLTCGSLAVTSEVAAKPGSTFRAVPGGLGLGPGSASGCFAKPTTGPLTPINVTDVTVGEIHSSTVGSGVIGLKFIADAVPTTFGPVTCSFSASKAPFTYTPGSSVITLTKADFFAEPAICEPGLLSAEFSLETDKTPFSPIILD